MDIAKKLSENFRFYYGWIIVAVSLISMAFWMGIRTNFSVFYVALLDDFAWNRGNTAGVQSFALITYTLLAPLVGGLIDRFGPRRVVAPGIFILFAGLVLCSTINSLAQFYIYYGLVMGTGITCIGIVSYSAILAHWFEKKRGLASGIAVSGMGLGTFVLVPLAQSFISLWGWRNTFAIIGALVLIILLPINAILLRHTPQELGQFSDGLDFSKTPQPIHAKRTTNENSDNDWTMRAAVGTLRFWALIGFSFFSIFGVYTILVHNVKFLVDQGVDKITAAFIFAMIGVISSAFRVFWGWLSDRIGRETTYSMGMVCLCLGVGSLLLFESRGSTFLIYSYLIFFGMGWGVTAPMYMSVSADLFRGKIFGLIYGFVEAGIGVAGAIGSWIGGFIFDQTQSYQTAFVLVIVAILLSGIFVWLAAPRKYRTGRHE